MPFHFDSTRMPPPFLTISNKLAMAPAMNKGVRKLYKTIRPFCLLLTIPAFFKTERCFEMAGCSASISSASSAISQTHFYPSFANRSTIFKQTGFDKALILQPSCHINIISRIFLPFYY
jgi:hypothetical protein